MFCTKCGTENEDNNVFCKNCGAKLVKPAVNSPVNPVPSSLGAAQAVNIKMIAGLAVALVMVVVTVVVVLMNGVSGGDSLFEQIKIGQTTAADVEKYFDQHNLGFDWDIADSKFEEYEYNNIFGRMGHNYNLILSCDEYNSVYDNIHADNNYSFKDFANTNTVCNDLSDTLWGADCEYFISMSGNSDDKDKKRKALYVSCVVTIDGKDEEREFRQSLNEYLKEHQNTKLKNQSFRDGDTTSLFLRYMNTDVTVDATYYPLEVIKWNGDEVLTCLCYNDALLESDGVALLTLYAEVYYTDKELNKVLKEQIIRNPYEEHIVTIDGEKRIEHTRIYIDWVNKSDYSLGVYFTMVLNEMYPEFEKAEFEAIQKEAPNFVCDFVRYYAGSKDFYEEGKNVKGIVIESCKQSVKGELVIPESIHDYPVIRILDDAFSGCSSLESITIPDSITNIGSNVFSGCSSLKSITIPDSIKYIENNAFSGCSNLKSIKIPDSVTNIGSNAFADCSSLTEITLPNGITEIKDHTFSGCSSLTDVKIPGSVTTIGDKAFENCGSLVNINIDNNITVIADHAFDGCEILVSAELNVRFPNAIPKPAWLEAYREYVDNVVCIVGTDNVGIPYLVVNYNGLYHYDGNGVEECTYLHDAYYNPVNNKLLIFQSGKSYSLIDLYTCNTELACSSYYDYNSDSMIYTDMNGTEISLDEYTRIYNEIMNQMGKNSEDECYMQFYSSIDEAFQAYISNRGSTSASASVSATNVGVC